jgi:predicted nuclease of predicted toxin-antitoxin system
MLRFLLDTQLPPRAALFLMECGCDAIHTTNLPNGHLLQDAEIRRIATEESRIIITKDGDFHDYYMVKGAPPRLLYLTLGNISNTDLLTLLAKNMSALETAFAAHNADIVVMNRTYFAEY